MSNKVDYDKVFGAVATVKESYFELPELTVYNQFDSDMCTGFAAATASEILFGRRFSPAWNISQSKAKGQSGTSRFLVNVLDAMCVGGLPLADFGILYEDEETFDAVKNDKTLLEKAAKFKADGYCNLLYANREKRDNYIKDAIRRFDSPDRKVAVIATSNSYMEFGENHCFVLVGWDDECEAYIFQNSLGKAYGEKGRGEIPKEKIDAVYAVFADNRKMPFEDVSEEDWFANDLTFAFDEGLINGTSETEYSPDEPITRAQVGALLGRFAKLQNEREERRILIEHQGEV